MVLLGTLVLVLLVAAVMAAALDRPVSWMQRRIGLPRCGAVLLVSILATATLIGAAVLVHHPFTSQSKVLRQGLPAQVQRLEQLPVVGRRLRNVDLQAATARFLRHLPSEVRAHRDLVLSLAETAFTLLGALATTRPPPCSCCSRGPTLQSPAPA